MAAALKRGAGPGVTALVGLGFQLTGWEVAWLGYVLLLVAALWALVAFAGPAALDGLASALRGRLGTVDHAEVKTARLFRAAVAEISKDLGSLAIMVRDREHKMFFDWYSIKVRSWDQHGALLATVERPDLHREVRTAYGAMERAFLDPKRVQYGRDLYHDRLKEDRANAAYDSALRALDELEKAERG